MIKYQTLSQWDADLEFKNEAEYAAYRENELACSRIHSLSNEVNKEMKILSNPRYSEYVVETEKIISDLHKKIEEWKLKELNSLESMRIARTYPEEYGKL
ncbi:hypothetical protein L8C07_05375 [Paenibacillus sp. CMAA1739]|uniref:hypothetical protein n=1 Tax=Paenibacillus ottowii TaxID=2315729 RepID=UPI002DBA2229|nr:hypothetical protein [Paenibacillus sp. CMAA1739]MEC4565368.1 hypothetical protein [Paenibacillus sp. CMAA1739]